MAAMFPELADAVIDNRRDAPRLSSRAAELLSFAVKAHYLEGDHENAVRLGELFCRAHGIYWPTSIDIANARDLLNRDDDASIAEHRDLISDMLAHRPNGNTGRISPRHATIEGPFSPAQWARYLSMVRLNLAGILRRLGRLDEAREELALSLEGLQDDGMRLNRHMRLAHLSLLLGDKTVALEHVEAARKIDLDRYDQWLREYKPMYPELDQIV